MAARQNKLCEALRSGQEWIAGEEKKARNAANHGKPTADGLSNEIAE